MSLAAGGEEELPYDSLLEYALDLEKQLEERNNTISELTRGEVGKRRRPGTDGGDSAYYEQENRTLREKIEEDTKAIAKLREDLATANVKIDGLSGERSEMDKRIKAQSQRIEQLERDNNNLLRKSQSVEEKSKEITKQKSDNIKVANQMAQENEQLRDENEQLVADMKDLKAKYASLEDALVKFANEKDAVEAHRDNLDVEKEQLRERIAELEADLLDLADKVDTSVQAEVEWENRCKVLQDEMAKVQVKTAGEVAQARSDTIKLQQQIVALQDNTQAGKVQRQLQELNAEHSKNSQLIEELQQYLVQTVAERDALADQLDDFESQIDQRVADKIASERNRVKVLEAALDRVKQDKGADQDHYQHLEDEKRELVKQVDELTHWKAVYEAGHGLQQLSRTERKLSDDLKRLGRAFEEQSVTLSKEQQSREVLSLAFERLKKECGKPASFHYPDLELHQEVQSTASALQSQIRDFEKQIDMLDEENTRLRKALRNQAGVVDNGEFKYPGMDAEMLMKVNEFAANIREGKIELPLNDRSRQLLDENKRLKADLKTLNAQLLHYERGGYSGAALGAETIVSDAFGADMKALVTENAEMHKQLRDVQVQLDTLVRNQSEQGNVCAADLAAILNNHSDVVLREIEELRRSSQALAPPHSARLDPVMAMPPSGRLRYQPTSPPRTASPVRQSANMAQSGAAKSMVGKLGLDLTPLRQHSMDQSAAPNTGFSSYGQGASYAQPAATPFWTPHMGRGGMPFATPGPVTPHGKQLLNNTIYNMNLPPEDWAMDVRELNTQLIECLELLYEREQELASQKDLISNYEQNLAEVKTQMVVLYHDYAESHKKWEAKEKQLLEEHKTLNAERDDLRLKLKRTEDMAHALQQQDQKALEWTVTDLTRKVTIYEVNEAILSRKYISLSEQLDTESKKRLQLEVDFAEMEATLKQRVLFLEQYKLAAGSRLALVQGKLDKSVPQDDYLALQAEMESLREDHLIALRREVEARAAALKSLDRARELRSIRIVLAHQQEDLEKARHLVLNLEAELLHQRGLTEKAVAAVQSSAEVSKLISDLAKFRGEASRLEVELLGSTRRAEMLTENLNETIREAEEFSARVKELEQREEQFTQRESEARKALVSYKLQFEGGLTRDEKDAVSLKCEKLELSLADSQREMSRLKELAEIAANQAQTLTNCKQVREEEIKELREYCTRLESRSEDEVLIGRLQRLLMSTKASYKAFVRKYQSAREGLRTREIALRIVETRLADQEKSYHESAQLKRKEILALKRALRSVKETIIETVPVGPALPSKATNSKVSESIQDAAALKVAAMSHALTRGSKLVTSATGARVVEISGKVDRLEELAESAVTQAAQKEEECRRLMGEVEELQAERSILQARLTDLDVIFLGAPTKQQSVATRLISLSEEVRVTKLGNLKQRRQIQTMREESKHLRTLISKMEADMVELEKSKVNSEASEFFAGSEKGLLESLGVGEDPFETELKKSASRLSVMTDQLSDGSDGHGGEEEGPEAGDPKVVQSLRAQLAAASKDASDLTVKANGLIGKLQETEMFLQEKESQLNYYERVLTEQGLGTVVLRQKEARAQKQVSPRPTSMTAAEQEQLQEAATATISSLKALLEEKNRLIEKYRDKIDQLVNTGHRKSRAERHAEDVLERLAQDELRSKGHKSSVVEVPFAVGDGGLGGKLSELNRQLTTQLEQADAIIADKDRTLMQLEQNLSMQVNQRERAELRCGEALKEMENMKADLLTLAQQLQESEARCAHLSRTVPGTIKVMTAEAAPAAPNSVSLAKFKQLERLVKNKDDKVKSYREIIVRLKEEFIRGEQEKAIAEVRLKSKQEAGAAISPEELRDLKTKIGDMHEGLRTAKDDLDKARRAREKLSHERNAALDDVKRLEEQLAKTESQHVHATQMVNRLKRDLDDSRRKEVRLRDKLKEHLDAEGASGAAQKTGKDVLVKAKDRIDQLERDIDLLKAQNAALRRADVVDAMISRDVQGLVVPSRGRAEEAKRREERGEPERESASPGRSGHVLGGGTGTGDDVRQQLHAKWESEKKLQKRVGVLEKRLQEMMTETDELRAQVQRGKDSLQQALATKEEAQKRASSAARAGASAGASEGRRLSKEDVTELEGARARIFALEERLQALTRRADVEQLNQIRALTHQLSIAQTRTVELERALGETEERRKKSASATASGRGLRDSEDRFVAQERIRDELDLLRRQKLELEASLLDRDARALESKFDLEAAEGEVGRMKRRLAELEGANRQLQTILNSGGGGGSGRLGEAALGGGSMLGSATHKAGASKRELELEGVIDAMKRVVEKLRAENDRLKKGVPSATAEPGRVAPADLEKRLQTERKRAERLEEELRQATERLKGVEETSQKVAAKQQQLAALRKQVKTKEDEVTALREDADRQVAERDALRKRTRQLEERLVAAEASLQSAQAAPVQASGPDAEATRRRLSSQQAEMDVMRAELDELRRRVREQRAESGPASGTAQEMKKLQEENTRLKQELSAFDMNFFDEIENLKYAHAEAMKKLRFYEQRDRR